jgi:membrane protein YqaA with SNARE-associated domain
VPKRQSKKNQAKFKGSSLSSAPKAKNKISKKTDSFRFSFTTTLIFALTALGLWILLIMLKSFIGFDILNWFKQLPFIYPIASYIAAQIKQQSFEGIVYAFSLSSLFFIPTPLEIFFIALLKGISTPLRIIVPAFFGLMLGQHVNFYAGRMFGKLIKKFIKRKTILMVQRRLRDYGSVSIFFINLLPLPYPITNFLAGSFRFPYSKWLLFTSLAIAIKLVFIAWLYALFF